MSESKPYVMIAGTLTEMEKPYQVQTFAAKMTLTSRKEPPVCQDFATYAQAVARICELLKDPKCPITGKYLMGIDLVRKEEPVKVIKMEIDAEEELPKSGIEPHGFPPEHDDPPKDKE